MIARSDNRAPPGDAGAARPDESTYTGRVVVRRPRCYGP